jgi:hypothetical protein
MATIPCDVLLPCGNKLCFLIEKLKSENEQTKKEIVELYKEIENFKYCNSCGHEKILHDRTEVKNGCFVENCNCNKISFSSEN